MWTVADKGAKRIAGSGTKPKRDNKRRKGNKKTTATANRQTNSNLSTKTTEHDEWEKLTLSPPPMPTSHRPGSQSTNNTPKNNNKTLNTKQNKNKRGDSNTDSSIDLGEVSSWEWNDVKIPTYIGGADDEVGGMISLQEIDDVECIWEEDETGGRTLKFKKSRKGAGKKGKQLRKAKKTDDADAASGSEDEYADDFDSNINWDDFVLVDEFSEEKAERGELRSIGQMIRDKKEEEENSDNSDNDNDEEDSGSENEKEELEVTEGSDGNNDNGEISSDDEGAEEMEEGVEEMEEADPDVDVSAWAEYGLNSQILRALKHCGFSTPTMIQAKTLGKALSGRDIIGAAETGSGKTLAFGLPMLHHIANAGHKRAPGLTGLVLTPTRELAIQVKDHLTAIAKFVGARVVPVVGGMSQQKQERLLNAKPDIIVATPGRFWEMVSTNEAYLDQLKSVRFLAIDEADRMLEPGHFREVKYIFKAINETSVNTKSSYRQTFVFSATLLKDLQLIKRRNGGNKKNKGVNRPEPGSMEDLIERVNFHDKNPAFVDVTRPDATAESLVETRIDCLANEKDYYLYYFLVRYPGRTLVFVNSIDSIRRIVPTLRLLNINVFGLHAQMEQRQRLKNLDRFKDCDSGVLIASDVAARGLDIPQVEYVVHYQLPRSGDIYVHRSGRTARARNEGLSVMLVSPEERKLYYKICSVLEKREVVAFPIDLDIVGKLQTRVTLAQQIDKEEHKLQKATHERNWLKKSAEELDIELDSDFMPSSGDEEDGERIRSDVKSRQKIKGMKGQLRRLLAQKVIARGVSTRYLSGGIITDLAERLVDSKNFNETIPTLRKESALQTAKSKIRAQKK